ncbi:MAG: rod shape-determining protein [Clostridia bacterium]|nr:rod shape-determining protein [Clostridia bacterium]
MNKIAIDLGSSVTKIYKIGSGIVLSEPSCVAMNTADSTVKAIGEDAKRLIGKTSDYTTIVFPIFEGEIVNEKVAVNMLKSFLYKAGVKNGAEAVFCVHCGFDKATEKVYQRIADECAFRKVSFVESPILAGLGDDVSFSEYEPAFCIDIGHGVTDIAAFSSDGIIAGISMNIGGGSIDVHIIDHLADLYDIKIGSLTSEKVKLTVGSLFDTDNQSMVVSGRDITTGKPCSKVVYAPDLYFPLQTHIDKIIEYALLVLGKLPAEVSAVIRKKGILLAGGTAKIAGIREYFANQLQMDVHVGEEPQMSVILGGGRIVGDPVLLHRVKAEV